MRERKIRHTLMSGLPVTVISAKSTEMYFGTFNFLVHNKTLDWQAAFEENINILEQVIPCTFSLRLIKIKNKLYYWKTLAKEVKIS